MSIPWKHQLQINKKENTSLKYLNDLKAFFEYPNDIHDFYKNIEEFNPNEKRKIVFVSDDMIAYMVSNKKFNPIVTEYLLEEEN